MKILIVDDDEMMREMLKEMLSRSGYTCITAVGSEGALCMLERAHFSIVVSDIRMPGLDGMGLLREIKEKHPDIDVISMTGYSKEYTFTDLIKAGASDFITKPFSKDELEAKISRIVKERELREKQRQTEATLKAVRDELEQVNHQREQALEKAHQPDGCQRRER